MRVYRLAALLLGLAVLGGTCFSQDQDPRKWSDEAEFSFVDTAGNTDVLTLAFKNLFKYTFSEKMDAAWKIGALYGRNNGETNAENYFTDLRLNYNVSERFYIGVGGGWLKDEFAGFNSRIYFGPTAGYKILTGPRHFLNAEGGVDYVREKYITDETENFASGRATGAYELSITEKSKFNQLVSFLIDFENSDKYYVNSLTSVTSALNNWLSLKGSYEVKFNNRPVPITLDKTDTILSLALVVTIN